MNKPALMPLVCALGCMTMISQVHRETRAPLAADVHRSESVSGAGVRTSLGGGRYQIYRATMLDLIRIAYGVDEEKIVGGPDWLNADRFELSFGAPEDATRQTLRPMLQELLAERFHLVTHPTVKEFPEFALTPARHLRLKRALMTSRSECLREGTPTSPVLSCFNISLAEFANELPQFAQGYFQGSPVMDKSGLSGGWDFTLRWTERNLLPTLGAEGISIYDALENQLGLKVDIHQVPIPVIAVDSVARMPTPNLPGVSQTAPPPLTRFEVASIKLSGPDSTDARIRLIPGGRVELRAFTLRRLIKFAWDFQDMDVRDNDEMLLGGTKPLNAPRFDVTAKALSPEASSDELPQPFDIEVVRRMLRTLLNERFKLETHDDIRSISVYAMIADHPRLRRANPSNRSECRRAPPARITASSPLFSLVCRNTTMPQLAAKLQGFGGIYIQHPVVDSTGLDGSWDFALSWSPAHLLQGCSGCTSAAGLASVANSLAAGPNASISLVEALERELGLKLKLRKLPMPVLVIDHVDSMPTEN